MKELRSFCLHLFGNRGKDYIESLEKTALRELALRSFSSHRNYKVAHSVLNAFRAAHKPQPSQSTPSWCECGKCGNMEREIEELCCKHTPCITEDDTYKQWREIHLDYSVLTAVLRSGSTAEFYRREAHRQFSYWKRGHLGIGERRPNPSCVVWDIRKYYPEDDPKNYVGFRESSKQQPEPCE